MTAEVCKWRAPVSAKYFYACALEKSRAQECKVLRKRLVEEEDLAKESLEWV